MTKEAARTLVTAQEFPDVIERFEHDEENEVANNGVLEPLRREYAFYGRDEYDIVTFNIERALLEDYDGAKILNEYNTNQGLLNETKRKKIVDIVVRTARNKMKRKRLNDRDFKILGEKIVESFKEDDIAIYYKPPIRRKDLSDQNQNDNSLVPVGTVDESDIIRDAISFLKHAAPTQLVEIIQKTKEAYKIRRFMYMNDRFFDEFPRFKDTLQLGGNNKHRKSLERYHGGIKEHEWEDGINKDEIKKEFDRLRENIADRDKKWEEEKNKMLERIDAMEEKLRNVEIGEWRNIEGVENGMWEEEKQKMQQQQAKIEAEIEKLEQMKQKQIKAEKKNNIVMIKGLKGTINELKMETGKMLEEKFGVKIDTKDVWVSRREKKVAIIKLKQWE
ncbi:hypothetical protein PV326_004762, partial [Microctonus aethiopoides]